ncbi:hypothetical protein SAMN05444148_2039 [Winogradskyella jejuensis]|uniref:Uncharacterized protein n=2 Tax=Winogradskyella jejuensis TaxID=1089305 RepID=A0A1M5T2B3_9FLAO|nr:hypothetical protein SAMN05444148_2039 [Winogradskyella jejuensis]
MPFKTLFPLIIIMLSIFICNAQSEEDKVIKTCNQFIQGRKLLRVNDSSLIKSVTSDSLYELLMLNDKYSKMLKARIIGADLDMKVKSVEIYDDCASCVMTSYEYYKIHLCKDDNDKWRIKGENSIFPTKERINRIKKKITNYGKQQKLKPKTDSIIKAVNIFFKKIDSYFLEEEIKPLKSITDDDTYQFLQTFYKYAKQRSGLEILHKELKAQDFTVGDYYNENGLTEFKFYKEDITLILEKNSDNEFIIVGFNGYKSSTITEPIMKSLYLEFLRAMKLVRKPRYRNKDLN